MSGVAEGVRAPSITSTTRLIVLLGDPVAHSRSPVMQNAAFQSAGVDGVYIPLRCGPEELGGVMRTLALSNGGGNVTLPHKERAATLLDVPSEAVRRTGACNTFWSEEGLLHGDNTDTEGFRRALRRFLGGAGAGEAPPAEGGGTPPESPGRRVLLLGAGGASRAVLVALLDEGTESITLLNRNAERARIVARRIGGERVRVAENPGKLEDESFDLVINATSLGLDPSDPLPVDLDRIGEVGGVFDLVYGAEPTPLVRAAGERGIAAIDGEEMLLEQGAVAFERWWGRPAPVEVMREALLR